MRIKNQLYIILAFLPVLLGIYFFNNLYNQVESDAVEQLVKQEEIYAKQAVSGIELFFTDCKNALNLLSNTESVINNNSEMPIDLKLFYESYNNIISGITRIDSLGVLVYTYPYSKNAIGKNVLNQKHNQKIKELQIPIISDVFQSVQGYKTLVYAYPVFKDGKYNGCISFLIPFDVIAKKFLENIKIGNKSNAFVLSSSGIELYCFSQDHIGRSIYDIYSDNDSIIKLADNMLTGKAGYNKQNTGWGIDNKAFNFHAVYYPVKLENTFWSLAVSASGEELIEITRGFQEDFILIFSLTIISFFGFIVIYFKSRHKAAKKLKWEEEKYKLVNERTGQIIYEFKINNHEFIWAGAIENVTGYNQFELEDINFQKFIDNLHEQDKEQVELQFLSTMDKNRELKLIYRFKHKSGEYIYLEDNSAVVTDGDKIFRVGTIKDITDRKIAELKLKKNKEKLEKLVEQRTKELKAANKLLLNDIEERKKTEEELKIAKLNAEKSGNLKSEFLAQMSHEIRTPINTILSFSSLVKDEVNDYLDEDLKLSFNGIGNAGKRIIRTIDLILNMSEMQTGSYEVMFKKIDLYKSIINPLMLEYKTISKEKRLDFKLVKEVDSIVIMGDEYTVNQMFANLIDNAFKYTNSGNITVKCYKTNDDKYCVEVSDTGIGISNDYLPYLFDSFSQEDQGYTRKFEGNGLGLALVKEYCDLNKAQISVKSNKGEGTTFRVCFNNN